MYKVSPRTQNTTFKIELPDAQSVFLVGDFNNWDTHSNPMKKGKDGYWKTELKLQPGEYQFRYLVDGNYWVNDDTAPQIANAFGTDNSLATIQPNESSKTKKK